MNTNKRGGIIMNKQFQRKNYYQDYYYVDTSK